MLSKEGRMSGRLVRITQLHKDKHRKTTAVLILPQAQQFLYQTLSLIFQK